MQEKKIAQSNSVNEWMNEWMNESMSEWISQSIRQSINPSTDPFITQSIKFFIGFQCFHLKKLKWFNWSLSDFWTSTRKKISWWKIKTIKTIECLILGTIGLIVAPWKFDVLKTSKFALEALLLGQIFVLRTSNCRANTLLFNYLALNTPTGHYSPPIHHYTHLYSTIHLIS